MCVGEDGTNVLFVCSDNVFLGVSICSVCESSDDIQPGLGFSVNVLCMLFECHPSV